MYSWQEDHVLLELLQDMCPRLINRTTSEREQPAVCPAKDSSGIVLLSRKADGSWQNVLQERNASFRDRGDCKEHSVHSLARNLLLGGRVRAREELGPPARLHRRSITWFWHSKRWSARLVTYRRPSSSAHLG